MPRGDQLSRQWRVLQLLGRPEGLAVEHVAREVGRAFFTRSVARMEWAGGVGAVTSRGDLKPFWPYPVFGQWTHAGGGTTFGLGGYRIEP